MLSGAAEEVVGAGRADGEDVEALLRSEALERLSRPSVHDLGVRGDEGDPLGQGDQGRPRRLDILERRVVAHDVDDLEASEAGREQLDDLVDDGVGLGRSVVADQHVDLTRIGG